jgi:hypothetical protein
MTGGIVGIFLLGLFSSRAIPAAEQEVLAG